MLVKIKQEHINPNHIVRVQELGLTVLNIYFVNDEAPIKYEFDSAAERNEVFKRISREIE